MFVGTSAIWKRLTSATLGDCSELCAIIVFCRLKWYISVTQFPKYTRLKRIRNQLSLCLNCCQISLCIGQSMGCQHSDLWLPMFELVGQCLFKQRDVQTSALFKHRHYSSIGTIQTSAANVQTGIADEYVRLYAPHFWLSVKQIWVSHWTGGVLFNL